MYAFDKTLVWILALLVVVILGREALKIADRHVERMECDEVFNDPR